MLDAFVTGNRQPQGGGWSSSSRNRQLQGGGWSSSSHEGGPGIGGASSSCGVLFLL
jgi:hypothetical protein